MTKANEKSKTTNLDDLSIKELVRLLNQEYLMLMRTKDNITAINQAFDKRENETLECKRPKD